MGKKLTLNPGYKCEYQSTLTLCLHGPWSTVQAHTNTHRHCLSSNSHLSLRILPSFPSLFPHPLSLSCQFSFFAPLPLSPSLALLHPISFLSFLISHSRCLPLTLTLPLFFFVGNHIASATTLWNRLPTAMDAA